MKNLLTFPALASLGVVGLLLIPAGCHAMYRHYHYNPAAIVLDSFKQHPLPSEMNITAEMNIPQKNGMKHVTKFLYLKEESDELVPTPGGLIAAHQNTESYDLDIELLCIEHSKGKAVFTVIACNDQEKSFNGSVTLPLNDSCTKTYQLPISDENNNPITITITSTIKK